MLLFLRLTNVDLAGDPAVLRLVNPKLNYSTLDSMAFEVEVRNVFFWPRGTNGCVCRHAERAGTYATDPAADAASITPFGDGHLFGAK
jgi:hypothetical protein